MGNTKNEPLDRRAFAKSMLGSIALGMGLSTTGLVALRAESASTEPNISANDMALITDLVDTIFPKTSTPSASETGTHEFVAFMWKNWMDPADKANFEAGLRDLESKAQNQYGMDYLDLDPKIKELLLQQAELESLRVYNFFAEPQLKKGEVLPEGFPFFYRLKTLTLIGYFTSEKGIEAHFNYLPVPGYFDGDEKYNSDDKGSYRYPIDETLFQGL